MRTQLRQTSTLRGTAKWVPAFRMSNNKWRRWKWTVAAFLRTHATAWVMRTSHLAADRKMGPFGSCGSVQVSCTELEVTLSTVAGWRFIGRSLDVVRLMDGLAVQPGSVHAVTYRVYVVYACSWDNSTSWDTERSIFTPQSDFHHSLTA